MKDFNTFVIEGFYGRPWTWEQRTRLMRHVQSQGMSGYLYAPKADRHLREDWRLAWAPEERQKLLEFAEECRQNGAWFGVGLSPLGLHAQWDQQGRQALRTKALELAELGIDHIALLFDDMRGDLPHLAKIQQEIAEICFEVLPSASHSLCPSYYSEDPILDLVFGRRPQDYLADLGRLIPKSVDLFWTGPRVCSAQISRQHCQDMAEILNRKPLLWDNEPVNDGVRMAPWIHWRAFPGRSAELREVCAGHGSNPMVQPELSARLLGLLPQMYQQGAQWDPQTALAGALGDLEPDLRQLVEHTLHLLSTQGIGPGAETETYMTWSRRPFQLPGFAQLEPREQELLRAWQADFEHKITQSLSPAQIGKLRADLEPWEHPLTLELIRHLDQGFAYDPACLT